MTAHLKVGCSASFANLGSHDLPGLLSAVFGNYGVGNLANVGIGAILNRALLNPSIFAKAYVVPPVLQSFQASECYSDLAFVVG